MSWPMHNSGQWNPGMSMGPDMNMGSYTPDQWALMQQQNWQQWTQWQQQYAQWQSQYGEKYAEQMQAIQAMGGMPPLPPPSAAPPPAPPPPEKPPPPPHENNQPLFGNAPPQPAPVPAPTSTQNRSINAGNNITINTNQTGNNSNWSYGQETPLSTVNAEALKKLAEEERLFDIQFQKWEEEIEKWKKDNVNHPDKQAYKEYEEKFESCRAQLLERRQQMNKKKARLLGTTPPPPPPQVENTNNTVVSVTSAPVIKNVPNAYSKPQQSYGHNSNQNINMQQQSYSNNSTQNTNKQQQSFANNSTQNVNISQQNYGNNQSQNYPDQNNMQYQQYKPHNQNTYNNRSNNVNIDVQDQYDSYSHGNNYPSNESFTARPSNPSFLLASESNKKDIPGLDLVPDTERSFTNVKQDVIDITEDKPSGLSLPKGPDYSTISKGINNILGDEKIMNILSMVRGQVGPDILNNQQNNPPQNQSAQYGGNNQNNPSYDQGYRNENQYDNRQNNTPYNRQGGNFPMQQNQEGPRNPPKRIMEERQDDMQQNQYNYDRNTQYGGNNMGSYDNGPRGGPPPNRPSMPVSQAPVRPLMDGIIRHPNENNFRGPPPGAGQQNINDYSRAPPGPGMHNNDYSRPPPGPPGPPERRPLHDNNINPMSNQPARPVWLDEPMFSPSLIVEYEHKPLRLKARDFIEPVHMFDYNHKSKDGDLKKKDFDKEADDLFSRKFRRSEKEYDYSGDRYSRDYYSRDYERRAPREDFRDEMRQRGLPRDDYDDRRRLDEDRRRLDDDRRRLDEDRRKLDLRYDDRRRDDRDKFSRRDDSYRERDRDFHRDRDRGRETRDVQHNRSHERDSRKRGLSKDSDISDSFSKRSKDKDAATMPPAAQFEQPKHIVMIDDLLESPGREMRPEKIVIILRGPPGSGKSYLAKLIRDKEAEHGGTVRIMSIDDYFMQEGEIEEKDPISGKMIKKPTLKYEYDDSCEETYQNSLKRAFKRSLTDGYFSFIVYDAVNDTLKSYADVWNLSRQNDFQVYICTMELDAQACYKRNIHNRALGDIEATVARFYPTPAHHIQLDATTLLQSGAITEVHMEDVDDEVIMEDAQEPERGSTARVSHSGHHNSQWKTTYN